MTTPSTGGRAGRVLGPVFSAAGVGGLVIGVAQSPTGPVLAASMGPVLILATTFAATAVLGMLVLVLAGGLSSDEHRRSHSRAMVELLL